MKKTHPIDPVVHQGVLKNGLSYSIRSHHKPVGVVEFRLSVQAGSLMERENELGLAHFLEHMAFEGGQHFDAEALRALMDQQGMQIGQEINASTGRIWTHFRFRLQHPDQKSLQQAMDLLADWMHGLRFPEDAIRKQKAIVLEEKRQRLGASVRIHRQLQPFLRGAAYGQLPIGEISDILAFNQARLRDFYQRWYRPELMRLVIVGDVDYQNVESLIQQNLSIIPARSGVQPSLPEMNQYTELQTRVFHDPEVQRGTIVWQQRLPAQRMLTKEDTRHYYAIQLYQRMLNERLRNIPPNQRNYTSAYIRLSDQYIDEYLLRLTINVKEERYQQALQQVIQEMARVKYFGFRKTELERQKQRILISLLDRKNKAEDRNSSSYAGQDEWFFERSHRYVITSSAYDETLARNILPKITLDEVNQGLKPFAQAVNQHLYWIVPDQHVKLIHVDDDADLARYTLNHQGKLQPYHDATVKPPEFTTPLASGSIVEETSYPSTGITTMKLSNGARVVIKPSSFKKDEVLFQAVSPGGLSVAGAKFRPAISLVRSAVLTSKIGGLKQAELRKYLADKRLYFGFSIRRYSEKIYAASAAQNTEDMLQFVALLFLEGNVDDALFTDLRQQMVHRQKMYEASPDWRKQQKVYEDTRPHNEFTRPLTWQDFENVQADDVRALFKQRYDNAGDFSFYFVGDVSVEKLRPLIRQYLAGLPAKKGVHEIAHSLPVQPLPGRITTEVKENIEAKSGIHYTYHQARPFSLEEEYELSLFTALLRKLVFTRLREQEKLIYSAAISFSMNPPDLSPFARLSIDFSCKPEDVSKLRQHWQAMVKEIQYPNDHQKPLYRQAELDGVMLSIHNARQRNMKDNDFWMSQLIAADRLKLPLDTLPEERVATITLTDDKITQLARRYLKDDNLTIIIDQPKAKP